MFWFRNYDFGDPNLDLCVDGKSPCFCSIHEGLLALKRYYVKCKCLAVSSAMKRLFHMKPWQISHPASSCVQHWVGGQLKTDRNRFFLMYWLKFFLISHVALYNGFWNRSVTYFTSILHVFQFTVFQCFCLLLCWHRKGFKACGFQ